MSSPFGNKISQSKSHPQRPKLLINQSKIKNLIENTNTSPAQLIAPTNLSSQPSSKLKLLPQRPQNHHKSHRQSTQSSPQPKPSRQRLQQPQKSPHKFTSPAPPASPPLSALSAPTTQTVPLQHAAAADSTDDDDSNSNTSNPSPSSSTSSPTTPSPSFAASASTMQTTMGVKDTPLPALPQHFQPPPPRQLSVTESIAERLKINNGDVLKIDVAFVPALKSQKTVQTATDHSFPLVDLSFVNQNTTNSGSLSSDARSKSKQLGFLIDDNGLAMQKLQYNKWLYTDVFPYPERVLFDPFSLYYRIFSTDIDGRDDKRKTGKVYVVELRTLQRWNGPSLRSFKILIHHKLKPPMGLWNLGNTCYLNSALQLILASPPLVSWLVATAPNFIILEIVSVNIKRLITTFTQANLHKHVQLLTTLLNAITKHHTLLKTTLESPDYQTQCFAIFNTVFNKLQPELSNAQQHQLYTLSQRLDDSNPLHLVSLPKGNQFYSLAMNDPHRIFCPRRATLITNKKGETRQQFCCLCQLQKLALYAHGRAHEVDSGLLLSIVSTYKLDPTVLDIIRQTPFSQAFGRDKINYFSSNNTHSFSALGHTSIHKPLAITNAIKQIMTNVSFFGSQEDSQECIQAILDTADTHWTQSTFCPYPSQTDEQVKKYWFENDKAKGGGKILRDLNINRTSPIQQLIGGSQIQSITCSQCKNTSSSIQYFTSLSVDIAQPQQPASSSQLSHQSLPNTSVSLDNCLKTTFTTSILQGDNAYQCDKCKTKVKATKQLRLLYLPNILFIHLNRFTITGMTPYGEPRFSKVRTHVKIPETFDFDPYVDSTLKERLQRNISQRQAAQKQLNRKLNQNSSPETILDGKSILDYNDSQYSLFATAIHQGSMHGGHYYSAARYGRHGLTNKLAPGDSPWFMIDDDDVRSTDFSTVSQQPAYVLAYIKDQGRIPATTLLSGSIEQHLHSFDSSQVMNSFSGPKTTLSDAEINRINQQRQSEINTLQAPALTTIETNPSSKSSTKLSTTPTSAFLRAQSSSSEDDDHDDDDDREVAADDVDVASNMLDEDDEENDANQFDNDDYNESALDEDDENAEGDEDDEDYEDEDEDEDYVDDTEDDDKADENQVNKDANETKEKNKTLHKGAVIPAQMSKFALLINKKTIPTQPLKSSNKILTSTRRDTEHHYGLPSDNDEISEKGSDIDDDEYESDFVAEDEDDDEALLNDQEAVQLMQQIQTAKLGVKSNAYTNQAHKTQVLSFDPKKITQSAAWQDDEEDDEDDEHDEHDEDDELASMDDNSTDDEDRNFEEDDHGDRIDIEESDQNDEDDQDEDGEYVADPDSTDYEEDDDSQQDKLKLVQLAPLHSNQKSLLNLAQSSLSTPSHRHRIIHDESDDDDDKKTSSHAKALPSALMKSKRDAELLSSSKLAILNSSKAKILEGATSRERTKAQKRSLEAAGSLFTQGRYNAENNQVSSDSEDDHEPVDRNSLWEKKKVQKEPKKQLKEDATDVEKLLHQYEELTTNAKDIAHRKDGFEKELDKGRLKKVRGKFTGKDKVWLVKETAEEQLQINLQSFNKNTKRKSPTPLEATYEKDADYKNKHQNKRPQQPQNIRQARAHIASAALTDSANPFEQRSQAMIRRQADVNSRHTSIKDMHFDMKKQQERFQSKTKSFNKFDNNSKNRRGSFGTSTNNNTRHNSPHKGHPSKNPQHSPHRK